MVMKVAVILTAILASVLTAFHIDFSLIPGKLSSLDGNITRILETSNLSKIDAEDLIMNLQSYVFNLGPLTRVMPIKPEVHSVARTVYQQGSPKFLNTPIRKDEIQIAFKWTDNQMKVLHFLYDNAEKHWQEFTECCATLNI